MIIGQAVDANGIARAAAGADGVASHKQVARGIETTVHWIGDRGVNRHVKAGSQNSSISGCAHCQESGNNHDHTTGLHRFPRGSVVAGTAQVLSSGTMLPLPKKVKATARRKPPTSRPRVRVCPPPG